MNAQPNLSPSPLEGLSLSRFQKHTYLQENVITVGVTVSKVLSNNPNRLFWIIINEGAGDVRVSTSPNITINSGWLISQNGGVISMYWEEDGEGVGYQLFAVGFNPATDIRILEVIAS